MGRLERIVDSLHLRYKVCDLTRAYKSHWQGQAEYVRLEGSSASSAAQLLEAGSTPEEILARFPKAKHARNLLVVADEEQDDVKGARQLTTAYRSIPLNGRDEFSVHIDQPLTASAIPAAGHWVVRYDKKGYDGPYVEAFYFPQGLTQLTLPKRYAALVQYADCLIDTTSQIYLETAKRTGRNVPSKETASQEAFLKFVHQQTKRPSTKYEEKLTDEEQEARQRAYHDWDSVRLQKVDALAATPRFRELLQKAATDDSNLGATSDEFEEYVARYYSPARALTLKRNRRVAGFCSMDDGPRVHALGIAQLSAEAVNWETFLRAHLDIMNDRFERMSDGSYAWEKRQTYLRELEELDINVSDLMLGISLRINNPSQNHYFGTVYRVGRALAETRQPRELEQRLLTLVADSELDTYNRLLAYYLFLNYNEHLPDAAQQQRNVAELNKSVQKLPAYLVARATVKSKQ
ncbi:hypothetical protein GCM10027175_35210 [Hymenobacter latericoloratus]